VDESSAYPPDLYIFADLGAGWYDRFKHLAWCVDQEWLEFSAECQEYPVTNDCAVGQPIRMEAEGLADLYRQIRQVGLDFAAADTHYYDPLAPTRPLDDTLTLPVVAMPPLDLGQLPADDGTDWGQRLMETAGIVPDPMVPKAQWLMHNASGWDWFLGFSYVSLSFIRDLDYMALSLLLPEFGVGLQGARAGAAWGSALRDDTGYENAIIQTALLSLGAFGLYLAKLPPGSTLGPAGPQISASGELVMAQSAINLDVAGRALVIAGQLGNVLFASNDRAGGYDNQGMAQEERVRDALTQQGYRQPFGTTDQEVAKNLGIKGKVADFVGYNDDIDTWLIAESKGGDMQKAVTQLENTTEALIAREGSIKVDLKIYTRPEQYAKFAQEPDGLAGYRLDEHGYLGWNDQTTNQWHYAEIDGIKISVHVAP
jgi:hypothetical protein